jgi:predicted phage tail protein
MTAQPKQQSEPVKDTIAFLGARPSFQARESTVVSVGPPKGKDADIPSAPAHSTNMIVAPRVIDEEAFDRLTNELRQLIDQAQHSAAHLNDIIAGAQASDASASKASLMLQERLRLGARMLQAFKSQITRNEELLKQFPKQPAAMPSVDEAPRAIQSEDPDAVERFAQQVQAKIDAMVEQAMKRIDAAISQRMNAVSTGIDAMAQRAEQSMQLLNTAEQNAAKTAYAQGQAAIAMREAAAETDAACDQAAESATQLAALFESATQRIESLQQQAESIGRQLSEACTGGEQAAKRIEEQLGEKQSIDDLIERTNRASAALDAVLQQLEPWRHLLIESDRDEHGTPRPIRSMIEVLRGGLVDDISRISVAMREFANRVDDAIPIGAAAPQDALQAAPRADIARSAVAVHTEAKPRPGAPSKVTSIEIPLKGTRSGG